MKKILRLSLKTLQYNFRSILLFELVYRLVFLTIYIRISNMIIKTILKHVGYSYLNIKNLVEVLKTPITYPLMLLLIIMAVLFAGYEMAVLYTGFRSAAIGKNMRISVMLTRGFARYIRMFIPSNIAYLLINGLVFYAFEGFWIYKAANLSKRVSELLFNLKDIKAAFFLLIIICIVLILAAIRYLFCTCFFFRDPMSGKQVIGDGTGFWKERLFPAAVMLVGVTAVYLVLYFVVHAIVMVIVATLVVIFSPHSYEMALIDVIGRYINMVFLYFGSIVSPIMYYGVSVALFSYFKTDLSDQSRTAKDTSYEHKGWQKRTLIIIAAIVLIGTIVNIVDVIRTGNLTMSDAFGRMTITSHRGSSYDAPENTLPAINKAIENLADYAEIDVRQTKDGEIILMHDPSVYRTTGVNKNVSNMTYDEISRLDAGSKFSREYAGTKIPKLEEVLDLCKGKIKLNIEIKAGPEVGDFIAEVVKLVEEYDMEEQCVFSSTTYSYLKRLKGININLKTGYIVAAGYGDYFADGNLDFYSVSSSYLKQDVVDTAHGYGKEVHAWTVNDRAELIRMKRIGVDNVITDSPMYAREVLYGEERTQSLVSYIKMLVK